MFIIRMVSLNSCNLYSCSIVKPKSSYWAWILFVVLCHVFNMSSKSDLYFLSSSCMVGIFEMTLSFVWLNFPSRISSNGKFDIILSFASNRINSSLYSSVYPTDSSIGGNVMKIYRSFGFVLGCRLTLFDCRASDANVLVFANLTKTLPMTLRFFVAFLIIVLQKK